MELTIIEIGKISKKFKIPEKDIIDFLADEDRMIKISSLKESFLREKNKKNQIRISQEWTKECKKFGDFEEFYIITGLEQTTEQFFFAWFKSCQDYKERREVYLCIAENKDLRPKFVKAWIEMANSLDETREAMTHAFKDGEEYKLGIKKIINLYKN